MNRNSVSDEEINGKRPKPDKEAPIDVNAVSSSEILTTDTFEAWKASVTAADIPDKESETHRCSSWLKSLTFISLIKVKHSGIWNRGKNDYSSNRAVVVSTIVTIFLLSYGIAQISTFGAKESASESLVRTSAFLGEQSTSALRSWYTNDMNIVG